MTDQNTSGADFAPGAAPSKTDGQAPANSAETGAFGASQPTGAFGSVRGSGLARGKRTSSPAASAAPAVKTGEYKPTALAVITPEREYKNPFTGETAVAQPEPAVEAPAPAVTAPAAASGREYITPQPARSEPSAPLPSPVFERSVAEATDGQSEAKPELTILPPAQPQKSSLSWERGPAGAAAAEPIFPLEPRREGRRDERSNFRGESRREPRPESAAGSAGAEPGAETRAPRSDGRGPRHEGGERRRDERPREEIDPRYGRQHPDPRDYPNGERPSWYPARSPRSAGRDFSRPREASSEVPREGARPTAPAKPTGFFGWLKNLFAGKPAAQPQRGEGERSAEGEHRGRRRRGGRGRSHGEHGSGGGYNAEHRGPGAGSSESSEGGESRHHGGESRGGYEGGGERRRSRGGRGRGRGRDDRGGYRSQGSQGGGAI